MIARHVDLRFVVCPGCSDDCEWRYDHGCDVCDGDEARGAQAGLSLGPDEYVFEQERAARDSLRGYQCEMLERVLREHASEIVSGPTAPSILCIEIVVRFGIAQRLLESAGFAAVGGDAAREWLPGIDTAPTAVRLGARGSLSALRASWEAVEIRRRERRAA